MKDYDLSTDHRLLKVEPKATIKMNFPVYPKNVFF